MICDIVYRFLPVLVAFYQPGGSHASKPNERIVATAEDPRKPGSVLASSTPGGFGEPLWFSEEPRSPGDYG